MEKLLKLLNEYDWTPTEWKQIWDKIYFDWLGWNSELHELIIISKYYGFIKWIVDNDKINTEYWPWYWFRRLSYREKWEKQYFSYEDSLLMLLSVQDDPISFLTSILK